LLYFADKKKRLGCFNPILGKIWTNPAIGPHFTQNWVKTTQPFLECDADLI